MRKFIFWSIVILIAIDQLSPPLATLRYVKAQEPPQLIATDIPADKTWVLDKIYHYADKYEVSAEEMYKVIQCETSHTFNPDIQSGYRYKNGKREQSWGLSQIHLPDHPHITQAEATDPDFALDFMASEFQAGRQWKWSCWKLLQANNRI